MIIYFLLYWYISSHIGMLSLNFYVWYGGIIPPCYLRVQTCLLATFGFRRGKVWSSLVFVADSLRADSAAKQAQPIYTFPHPPPLVGSVSTWLQRLSKHIAILKVNITQIVQIKSENNKNTVWSCREYSWAFGMMLYGVCLHVLLLLTFICGTCLQDALIHYIG